jgi:hypothetical protein
MAMGWRSVSDAAHGIAGIVAGERALLARAVVEQTGLTQREAAAGWG